MCLPSIKKSKVCEPKLFFLCHACKSVLLGLSVIVLFDRQSLTSFVLILE